MGLNVRKEQKCLEQLSIAQLKDRYHELSQRRVSIKCKRWYIKRILWLMQASCSGDISEESRLLAKQISANRPLRKSILRVRDRTEPSALRTVTTVLDRHIDQRIPEPGASLVKTYRGKTIRVIVRRSGFEFDGQQFKSLTAIARVVTGQRNINGMQFFNLGKKGGTK
jgi:hypothetical protein